MRSLACRVRRAARSGALRSSRYPNTDEASSMSHSLRIRTWNSAVLALALVANGACGGDDDATPGDSTNGKTQSSGGNSGGNGKAGTSGNAGGDAPENPGGG